MAERRMFTKKIVDSDAFLDMPLSSQALYFHLSMRADDEGFINNPKKIQRMVGASDDDMKVLVAKRFILVFESGVIVIKHWKMHNYIQADRFHPTDYKDERNQLYVKDNKSYSYVDSENVENSTLYPKRILDASNMLPEVRLGKDSNSIIIDNTRKPKTGLPSKFKPIVDAWNKLPLRNVKRINEHSQRHTLLTARLKQYSLEEIIEAIESIEKSSFLLGQNKSGWTITFDWFLKPGNFAKVLEGNYIDKEHTDDSIMSDDVFEAIVEKHKGADTW